jgi:hypothetical protein
MINLKDVKNIFEVNSTYLEGELHKKFLEFTSMYDRLGLKADGIDIDLGSYSNEEEEQEGVVLEIPTEGAEKRIPTIWALSEDIDIPIFKPLFTDEYGTDYDKALQTYGMDIIELTTGLSEIYRTFTLVLDGIKYSVNGNLREIQSFIIKIIEFPETRIKILKIAEESFYEREATHSFLVDIPAHKKNFVMRLEGVLIR